MRTTVDTLEQCLFNTTSEFNWSEHGELLLKTFKRELFLWPEPRIILLLCLYVAVFTVAVAGNSLVLVVILGDKAMQSSTSFFLVNMAAANLLGKEGFKHK